MISKHFIILYVPIVTFVSACGQPIPYIQGSEEAVSKIIPAAGANGSLRAIIENQKSGYFFNSIRFGIKNGI